MLLLYNYICNVDIVHSTDGDTFFGIFTYVIIYVLTSLRATSPPQKKRRMIKK